MSTIRPLSVGIAREWLQASAFHAFLGVEPVDVAEERVRLRLPFDPRLTNNGSVLHGGLAAALSGLSSRALWLAAGSGGVAQCASLHVSYVSAAEEDLWVTAHRVRVGRNVCFVRIEIESESDRRVADALVTLRIRSTRAPAGRAHAAVPEVEPGPPPAPRVVRAPFLLHMGFDVRGMGEGASHVGLPWRRELADGPGFHEGALLALLDCAGAMSSHAAHAGSAARNATIALQAQILATELPGADLVAFGRCATRDDDVFWNEVRIARDSNRELLARGSVIYRIADTCGFRGGLSPPHSFYARLRLAARFAAAGPLPRSLPGSPRNPARAWRPRSCGWDPRRAPRSARGRRAPRREPPGSSAPPRAAASPRRDTSARSAS